MPSINFCSACGKKLDENTGCCQSCGTGGAAAPGAVSKKSGLTAFLLCLFLGSLGIHRFYVGKIGTGILMLLTSGGLGIWYLYDLITIVCNNFKDSEGHSLEITRNPSTAKTVALVVGSIIAAFLLMFATIATVLFLFLGSLADVAQSELSALRAGDFEKAYSYTAKDFKKDVTIDDFKAFVENNPALRDNISASFPERKFENNYATLLGTLKLKNGQSIPIEIQLIKEDNVWKIIFIDLKPAEEDNQQSSESSATATDNTTMTNVFENKKYKFSIKYPSGWDYEQPDLQSVDFSWKTGHHPYYAQVNIQVIPSKKIGGIYETTNDVVQSLQSDILKDTKNAKFLSSGDMGLPLNPHKFSGEYFITTYTYNGEPMKKMQIILMEKNSDYIFSWGFTASADHYNDDLPLAKSMYESWMIQ